MRNHGAENAAEDLRADVERRVPRGQLPAQCKHKGDGRIKMGSGDRSKNGDENDKDRTGREGVAQ